MSRHIGSLNNKLRAYFKKGLLYTVDQLAILTHEDRNYVMIQISRMKNKKYCGKDDPLPLVQDIDENNVKRWGLRGSTKYANIGRVDK